MRDIYEKCQKVTIEPRWKANGEKVGEVLIQARVSTQAKDGSFSYADFNCCAENLEKAEIKLRIYVESWLNASAQIVDK